MDINGVTVFSSDDYIHMAHALRLAAKGLYSTSPNPRVGCVMVKQGRVIGEGYHIKAGEGHAEVNALANCTESASGATAYVTLEPCSHYGKTPPCAAALIKAGISRVVAAMQDPNPLVAGGGGTLLQQAGIQYQFGLLEAQARVLNPGFIKRFEQGVPYVRIKMACSVDGRTAMASGESKWITSADARQDVQLLRARSCAIVTGAQTVRHDDPSLTVRPQECDQARQSLLRHFNHQPERYVVSFSGVVPVTAKVFSGDGCSYLVTAEGCKVDAGHSSRHLTVATDATGQVDVNALLSLLGQKGVNELLVESGSTLAGRFVEAGAFDELWMYVAPVLMGSDAMPVVGLPITSMRSKIPLTLQDSRMIGNDMRMIYSRTQQTTTFSN
ncbi:MAG: bifunctional diaminohydroxyphosphoribosylaminopyrimidine deaminase/5-amino-6-(5-phosphoribosylamino)uracil reductase RibD [Hahellaceae bacterium]|nr:bifunctional diaminohydroxyphosphoribosylaminopyrimidine deaminase/5-amino-6-(5-phosphoribosylamino)uracil reductase RibD [Hahellaceae bacterium]MCP5210610.1 bifunctional diaminohydroxyphosphoribosylaminopyrimidine deaminase/5-amino-6-(5-phosphoribosylamino)uracil reductase RibD [Hahellaceae bacterium]